MEDTDTARAGAEQQQDQEDQGAWSCRGWRMTQTLGESGVGVRMEDIR